MTKDPEQQEKLNILLHRALDRAEDLKGISPAEASVSSEASKTSPLSTPSHMTNLQNISGKLGILTMKSSESPSGNGIRIQRNWIVDLMR